MKTLKRFFDDINRLANYFTANPPQEVLVVLCNEDRYLLAEAAKNYRRNKPRVKSGEAA